MENEPVKVLIADDHPIVRNALKSLLIGCNMSIAAEAECGAEVLELLDTTISDLLILDMSMPGKPNGPALIEAIISGRQHTPPILVFSMSDEARLVSGALQAGASGYITKDSDPALVLSAIEKVLSGGKYVSPQLAEKVLFRQQRSDPDPKELLSKREYQVFLKLLEGKSVEKIAEELFISRQTVGTHKSRMMSKLGLCNNVEIVCYGIRHGLVSP